MSEQEWQPIDTAPKDGTRILATGVQTQRGYWMVVVRKLDDFDGWYTDPGKHYVRPTHWMPLPDPPPAEGR